MLYKRVFSHDIYLNSDFQIPVNVLRRENKTVLERTRCTKLIKAIHLIFVRADLNLILDHNEIITSWPCSMAGMRLQFRLRRASTERVQLYHKRLTLHLRYIFLIRNSFLSDTMLLFCRCLCPELLKYTMGNIYLIISQTKI